MPTQRKKRRSSPKFTPAQRWAQGRNTTKRNLTGIYNTLRTMSAYYTLTAAEQSTLSSIVQSMASLLSTWSARNEHSKSTYLRRFPNGR